MTGDRAVARSRPYRFVLVANMVVAALLVVTGLVVVWANDKVGDRLVVNIDGTSGSSVTTPDGEPVDEWRLETGDLGAENFLVTGSDNGACPEKGDGTAGGIGDRTSFGERSDTIMILRVDPTINDVAVLSFPRDLWVTIAGTTRQSRINSAFDARDPTRLIRTIDENFGVPVDHYVNVNLCAFKEIVDSVGGVRIPFSHRTKDERVGFREVGPGCVQLRGSQALAYVRSRSGYRYYDESRQKWVGDPTGDLGRISRQQDFLRRSMQRALDEGTRNPVTANALLNVGLERVITDDGLTPRDLLRLAQAMRNLDTNGVNSFTIEWSMRRIGAESVLVPVTDTDSMREILAVFRGDAVIARPGAGKGTQSTLPSDTTTTGAPITTTTTTLAAPTSTVDAVGTPTTLQVVDPQQDRLGVFPPDDPACR
jgi:LCP family protein required for cell wall assembly